GVRTVGRTSRGRSGRGLARRPSENIMNDQKNTLLAIVLSAIVLIVWQVFFGVPQMQQREAKQQQQQQAQNPAAPPAPGGATSAPPVPGQTAPAPAAPGLTRDDVVKQSARVAIATPSLKGSIALKGGRIDDVALSNYRETVDPKSPPIELLSPSGSPSPFYAEFGWLAAIGANLKVPDRDTVWQQEGSGALTPEHPVVLVYDNGDGLTFRRTISVDDKYLVTIKEEIVNKGAQPVTVYPYGLISRHGTPPTLGYYILHEGLIGVLDGHLEEHTYKNIEDKKTIGFQNVAGWLGITDKYWAATL